MRFLSVCSGIEAASVAWNPLGWHAAAFAEIEPFPSAVLAHHYPTVPNRGDMTKFQEWPDEPIDLLCGGTPCQSFSVAGLRKGLDDPRGNLMLTFGAIAARYRPRWLVWENVPGVLSSNEGRDFGAFLGILGQLGYGFAYRVLDAQFFGVAQRRRRVFVVGCLGDWRSAAAVLFERHSLSGHPAPSRETRQGIAGCLTARAGRNGGMSNDDIDAGRLVSHALTGEGFDASEDGGGQLAVALALRGREGGATAELGDDAAFALRASSGGGDKPHGLNSLQVRRLTPTECERLQGFPDGWTAIPWRGKPASECPDGPRYKALGNSWAVPCARWIGERISAVDAIRSEIQEAA